MAISLNYTGCVLCPAACGADRNAGETGVCGMPAGAFAAAAVLHRGEEPPLTGGSGSGTVFFSGCTLGCPFCQNMQISSGGMGRALPDDELADVFLALQQHGAANINLVTATQFIPSVLNAAAEARSSGLVIPFVWNSSGWETKEAVEALSDVVDIWLPDIKTLDQGAAGRLFSAPEYPLAAASAVTAMADDVEAKSGAAEEDGLMKRGLIVRHLVMPGELESTRGVLKWYSENLSGRALLSLMVQYTDTRSDGSGYIMPDSEYQRILDWLEDFGIEEGFVQEPEAASAEWIPDFSRSNPFPEAYSVPVWHWLEGFCAG